MIDYKIDDMLADNWEIPFERDVESMKSHLLRTDQVLFLSTKLERVDIEVDSNKFISDLFVEEYTIR